MSAGNGKITVGNPSTRTFVFPGGFEFTCDAICVYGQYLDMRRAYVGEGNAVPPDRMTEFNAATVEFVQGLLLHWATKESPAPTIDGGYALDFMTKLGEINNELADFFVPKSRGKPSSRESTELIFSTSDGASSNDSAPGSPSVSY